MISRHVCCKSVPGRTMFSTGQTRNSTVVHMPVLHMLGEVGIVPALAPAVGAGVQVLAHVDNLGFNHVIQLFEKLRSYNYKNLIIKL